MKHTVHHTLIASLLDLMDVKFVPPSGGTVVLCAERKGPVLLEDLMLEIKWEEEKDEVSN